MKTYEEVIEWLREYNVLNKLYRNIGHHSYGYTRTTIKQVLLEQKSNFIDKAFYWKLDPSEDWRGINRAYKHWFNS